MKKIEIVKTKVGPLEIVANEGGIESISFARKATQAKRTLAELKSVADKNEEKKAATHIEKAKKQLHEYFEGRRLKFELDLAPQRGTTFQKKVWRALCGIPFGKTQSYSDVALRIGSPKAVRAVGLANNRNPIAIVVPCHRVIGKSGSLVGYAGGLNVKADLLKLEGAL